METVKMLWGLLSGKKTTIGALLMFIPTVLKMLGYNEWSELVQSILDILLEAGVATTFVGIADKVRRTVSSEKIPGNL